MAFHSVQSIPPLLKTQEHGEENTSFQHRPCKRKVTAQLSNCSDQNTKIPKSCSHYVFFLYIFSHHPSMLFLSTPTVYRVSKQKGFQHFLNVFVRQRWTGVRKLCICLTRLKKNYYRKLDQIITRYLDGKSAPHPNISKYGTIMNKIGGFV